MKSSFWFVLSLAVLSLFALASVALASPSHAAPAATLVDAVRKATSGYKDVEAAQAAGYGLFHGCVSGPQGGAMGVHYVNGDLVGDGEVDALRPEALLYEAKGGKLRQLGVEYVVI